jgi:hypothetical protein
MLTSIKETARGDVQVCAWQDSDDPTRSDYPLDPIVRYGVGRRTRHLSDLWNRAWTLADGSIGMLAGDDMIFRTPGWDQRVAAAFRRVPDRVLMVYTKDGTRRQAPVHPFVSRAWIDIAGFTPTNYPGWFADEWIWSIAAELGRVSFLGRDLIQHNQTLGSDQTYLDAAEARQWAGGVDGLRTYFYSAGQVAARDRLVALLRGEMTSDLELVPPGPPRWYTESLAWAKENRR